MDSNGSRSTLQTGQSVTELKTVGPGIVASSNATDSLLSRVFENPFFTAGFGLAGIGAAVAVGRRGLQRAVYLLRRRLLIDVEITRHDESYQWLLHWMAVYQRERASSSHQVIGSVLTDERPGLVTAIARRLTPGLHHLQVQTTRSVRPDGSASTDFSLVPGPGKHLLRYRNAFISVNRQREKSLDLQTGTPFETVSLTTLYAHRHVLSALFQEAHQLAVQMQEGKTVIYTTWGTEWKPFGHPRRKRPIDSVVLEEGVKERLIDDFKGFLGAREWYLDRGIPYRRGYLLHGPPGTGKSSFIQALAGELNFNIGMLNCSERGLTDDRLNHLLMNVPPRTIVLLEDADAAFRNRSHADEHGYRGTTVTFSGLLNALDGVASAEERIVFLTTNHIERLDEALVRPGRVDMALRLGLATRWQVEQLWDRFFSEEAEAGPMAKRQLLERAEELGLIDNISTAAWQGLFLLNKGNPARAAETLHNLIPQNRAADKGR